MIEKKYYIVIEPKDSIFISSTMTDEKWEEWKTIWEKITKEEVIEEKPTGHWVVKDDVKKYIEKTDKEVFIYNPHGKLIRVKREGKIENIKVGDKIIVETKIGFQKRIKDMKERLQAKKPLGTYVIEKWSCPGIVKEILENGSFMVTSINEKYKGLQYVEAERIVGKIND